MFVLVFNTLHKLGGYLPPSSLGPTDLTPLLTRLFEVNGSPLVDVYMDYDEVKRNRMAIYIDLPQIKPVLSILFQNQYIERKMSEKQQAQQRILRSLLKGFLPKKMSDQQQVSEYQNIINFISDLDKVRNFFFTLLEFLIFFFRF